jgi:hypothetical protein
MIIKPETLKVLQNFQTINSSIIIRPGSTLETMSPGEGILAKAKIEDDFPRVVPIYDLAKFLGILSLSKEESDVNFGDRSMTITQGSYSVIYAYTPEDQIISPPIDKIIKIKNPDVTFELTQEVWMRLSQAMRVMGFSEFAFVGENGVLSIQALSTKNDSSDTYSTDIGETDKTFTCIIEASNMRLMPADYTVSVMSKGISYFQSGDWEYWIGISKKSVFV